MSERLESLTVAVNNKIDARFAQVHIGMWAKVISWDGVSLEAQPIANVKYNDGEVRQYPILTGIPVIWPSGGSFQITFPLDPGDRIWLAFHDCSQEECLFYDDDFVTPSIDRRFDLNDAVAFPGGRPFVDPLENVPSDAMFIGKAGGLHLRVKDERITVGHEDSTKGYLSVNSDGKFAITRNGVDLLGLLDDLLGVLQGAPILLVDPVSHTGQFDLATLLLLTNIQTSLATIKE